MTGPNRRKTAFYTTVFSDALLSARLRLKSKSVRERVSKQAGSSFDLNQVGKAAFEHPAVHVWSNGLLQGHPPEQVFCAWLPDYHPAMIGGAGPCVDSAGHAYLPDIGVVRVPFDDQLGSGEETEGPWLLLRNLDLGEGLKAHRLRTTYSSAFLGSGAQVLDAMRFKSILARSTELLRETAPTLHRGLQRVTHELVLFSEPDRTSFAHEQAPGTIFVCLREMPTVPFFVEELAHQCGHLLLFAVTEDPSAYFHDKWDIPLDDPDIRNRRSRYVMLHGIFTLSMICAALHAVVQSGGLDKEQELEAIGRIAFASHRFEPDAVRLLEAKTLSSLGLELVASAAESVKSSVNAYRTVASELNISGHGYDFSADVFSSRNPMRDRSST